MTCAVRRLCLIVCLCFLWKENVRAQVLFDATKAEMAGNADWIIDADAHDLRVQSGDGSGTRGSGSSYPQSDPQRVPTPAASGITSTTKETYWQGALSAWAVALAKNGQTVIETLPVFTTTGTTRSRITYQDGTNAQDLSHYRLFVVCEPNITFTTAEKTAILNYVKNGGALFLIADHDQSDRNNDGIDAVGVWNDLFSNNAVQANPFGFSFNRDDVSPTTEVTDATTTNPLTHSAAGTVTKFIYANGATMTINNSATAHAAVWQTSSKSNSQVMALYGTFGAGKFVAVGDSSPFDDGTGDPGDTLYDGWDDGNGDDAKLITNASLWLLAGVAPTATTNPANNLTTSTATLNASVNSGGLSTGVYFQYGLGVNYGSTTPTQTLQASNSSTAVNANLTDLTLGEGYHFRVVAVNTIGTTYGADAAFQVPRPPPSGTTTAASGVASSQATLNANVSPQGIATTYHFDFGTDTNYGWTSAEKSAGSGTSAVPVVLLVTGLVPGTTYHFRIVTTSANGTVNGADVTFTTPAFVDSDGDGIPDDYETAHGLDPHNAADALLDDDGDGQSNLVEYLTGTDPANRADSFRMLGVTVSGTDVIVSFTTVFGKRYVVECSPSLVSSAWSSIGNALNGNGTPFSFTDASGLTAGTGPLFYRARVVP